MSVSVHPTCVVGPGAELGEGTEVGPYAVIESGVVVGQRCRIASHAIIREFTRMASDNQVFEHAVIGGTPQDFGYSGARSSVRIGSGNLFREGVTVHRACHREVLRVSRPTFLCRRRLGQVLRWRSCQADAVADDHVDSDDFRRGQ